MAGFEDDFAGYDTVAEGGGVRGEDGGGDDDGDKVLAVADFVLETGPDLGMCEFWRGFWAGGGVDWGGVGD